jgi:RNA polymerase sigma-70 factor (ECF subfamily)
VAAANAGSAEAFQRLYERYRSWVVSLAWRFTRDRELALDVLQETFIYLLGKLPDLELRASMKTFLYPVVRHLSLSHLGRARRHRTAADPLPIEASPDQPDRSESAGALAAAVDRLPAGHREVLMLRVVDGLSLQEIAVAMELPLGTVKSRLHHALAALREDPLTKKYFLE